MTLKNLCAGMAALAAVAATVGAAPAQAQDKKPYTIYLSNNFVGNDWRQQMDRVAEVAVTKAPLAGRVDLKIENVENTVQAQINSLNNIIRAKPDAILIDAGSDTALNPTIKKACDAGIVVISFDQVVTEPCAYALESDWDRIPAVLAEWMAKTARRQGQGLRRPRPRRRADLGPAAGRLREGAEEVSGHRGHRLLQRRIRARAGAGRRRQPARRPSRRSTAS